MRIMFSIQCEKQNQYFMQSYNFFFILFVGLFSVSFLTCKDFASFEKLSRRIWVDI